MKALPDDSSTQSLDANKLQVITIGDDKLGGKTRNDSVSKGVSERRTARRRNTSMCPEKEKGYRQLFSRLDKNKDGQVYAEDVDHLTPSAEDFIRNADADNDGKVMEEEFVKYCHQNEKRLHRLFANIDTKQDGVIDQQELKRAFSNAGINFSQKQFNNVLKSLDLKGNAVIDRDEWVEANILIHADNEGDFLHQTFKRVHDMDQSINYLQKLRAFPGAALAKTLSAPFDRMKIFYQVYSENFLDKKTPKMTLRDTLKLLKNEGGYTGLFRGNGINVIKSMPEQAIKLECNKLLRGMLHDPWEKELPIYKEIIAGAFSGILAQTAVYPLDTLKVRIALSRTNEFRNSFDALRYIYNEPTRAPFPLCNFYRGFCSSLGVIVYVATELTVYNKLSQKTKSICKDLGISPVWGSGVASFAAPAIGTVVSYPLQLTRTKYQSDKRPKMSYTKFVNYTFKHYGIQGFYTGLVPNLFKSVISGSIILGWWSFVQTT